MFCSNGFDEGLPPSCTALIFKLGRKMGQQEFLDHFNSIHGYGFTRHCAYNFVHLPWPTLAIVNFLNEEACADCWLRTKKLATGDIKGVLPATHHGLQNSLVAYLSRAKGAGRTARLPPLVFCKGRRITVVQACQLLGLDLTSIFPHEIHMDLALMSQKATWDWLEHRCVRILIDL